MFHDVHHEWQCVWSFGHLDEDPKKVCEINELCVYIFVVTHRKDLEMVIVVSNITQEFPMEDSNIQP